MRTPELTTKPRKETKRLRDYAAEDAAAVSRGRIDVYVSKAAFQRPPHDGSRHRPVVYPDALFQAARVLRELHGEAYRPLQGYVASLATLANYEGRTPDHVTLWRRSASAALAPLPDLSGARDVVVDSTGVTAFGPGEWRREHSEEELAREYVKLHAARDVESGRIVGWELTSSRGEGSGDSSAGARIVDELVASGTELRMVAADGAYDRAGFRDAVFRGGARCVVPPREDGVVSAATRPPPWAGERDAAVMACFADRKAWKRASGYHARSLAETTFSRFQALFGTRVRARLPERQALEVATRVWLANQFVVRSTA